MTNATSTQMNLNKKTAELEDVKINVKIKIAALWVTVNLLILYQDVYNFFKPGVIEDALAGKVWEFQITQGYLLGVLILQAIPSLMVFLSLILKPKANRWVNIILGILHIVLVVVSVVAGASWAFYIFTTIVEVVLLSLIVWYAWKWPKQEG